MMHILTIICSSDNRRILWLIDFSLCSIYYSTLTSFNVSSHMIDLSGVTIQGHCCFT